MEDLQTIRWVVAGCLMILFSWVALGFVLDSLPWKLIDKADPRQKVLGLVIMGFSGSLGLALSNELLHWVWTGLQHILGFGMEEIIGGLLQKISAGPL